MKLSSELMSKRAAKGCPSVVRQRGNNNSSTNSYSSSVSEKHCSDSRPQLWKVRATSNTSGNISTDRLVSLPSIASVGCQQTVTLVSMQLGHV